MKARGTHSLPKQESLVRELHRTPTVVEELGAGLPPVPAFNRTWHTFDYDPLCWLWVGSCRSNLFWLIAHRCSAKNYRFPQPHDFGSNSWNGTSRNLLRGLSPPCHRAHSRRHRAEEVFYRTRAPLLTYIVTGG